MHQTEKVEIVRIAAIELSGRWFAFDVVKWGQSLTIREASEGLERHKYRGTITSQLAAAAISALGTEGQECICKDGAHLPLVFVHANRFLIYGLKPGHASLRCPQHESYIAQEGSWLIGLREIEGP